MNYTQVQAAVEQINRESLHDPVTRPLHYTEGAVECIEGIEAAICNLSGEEAYLTGQCIKYLWRWRAKSKPLQDLQKAKWYLERLIAKVKDEPVPIGLPRKHPGDG